MALNDDSSRREPVIGRSDSGGASGSSGNGNATDDNALHDPVLGRIYAQTAVEAPPAALDAALRAAARREVDAGPASGGIAAAAGAGSARGKRNWQVPLALAAVVVLSVSLVDTIKHEKGDELARPPAAAVATPEVLPAPSPPPSVEPQPAQPPTPKASAVEPAGAAGAMASPPAVDSGQAAQDAVRRRGGAADAPRTADRVGGGTPWVDVPPRRVAPEMPAGGALAQGTRERQANKAAADSMEWERAPAKPATDLPPDSSLARPRPAPFPEAKPAVPAAGAFSAPPSVSSEAPRPAGASIGIRGFDRERLADRQGTAPAEEGQPETRAEPAAAPPAVSEAAPRVFVPVPARPAAKPAARPVPPSAKPAWLAELELQPPQKWLDRLAEFRRDGRVYDADMLLAEFRKRFPDDPAARQP